MKTKRFVSLILTLVLFMGAFAVPTSASHVHEADEIVVVIEDNELSDEMKEKIIAYYTDDNHDDATTYGLTCTLLGHNLETSKVHTITHKARAISPRCLKKTYDHDACTRCDYQKSTLRTTEYIVCCA